MFLIVGGGRVGLRTARTITEEGYEVVIVERDLETVRRIEDQGFTVVQGDGGDPDVLEEAGIASARAVGALTGDLSTNYAACVIGSEHGCRTVLRIDEDYRESIFEQYAEDVDEMIYPEQLGAMGARTALLGGDFNLLADLTEELQLLTVTIPSGSPAIGERVNGLEATFGIDDARIYAHGRAREALTIPLPGTLVEAGDHLAMIIRGDAIDAVRSALIDGSAGDAEAAS